MDKRRTFDVTVSVTVYDPKALLAAAQEAASAMGLSEVETEDWLNDGGEVQIESCLVCLLDPGVQIGSGFEIDDSGACETTL